MAYGLFQQQFRNPILRDVQSPPSIAWMPVFPSSGPGQGRRERAAVARSPKAILDAVLNLGITLRHAIDGEVSHSG
jgi:hypothetical protein